LIFVWLPVFGVLALARVIFGRPGTGPAWAAFSATAFLALPYTHFAYSRADVPHLAQGIFPMLLGSLIWIAGRPALLRWPLVLGVALVSMIVPWPARPAAHCAAGSCVPVEISRTEIMVPRQTARVVALLRGLAAQYAPNGQPFLAEPFMPGAYALLHRRSPAWEIYALFPRPDPFEQAEIARITAAEPTFALISDQPLDGRDELRYSRTHPLIYAFLESRFVSVSIPHADGLKLFLRRSP
jgi:hypothetical protein